MKGRYLMQKRMKWFAAICLLLFASILSACGTLDIDHLDPPIGHVQIDDLDEYGKYNDYVDNLLQKEYRNLLPADISSDQECEYQYYYHCALLSDATFSIYLKRHCDTQDEYASERARIEQYAPDSGNQKVVYIEGTPNDIEALFDDELFDGMSYPLEVVSFDDLERTIEYYIAEIWEGQVTSDNDKAFLRKILEESAT